MALDTQPRRHFFRWRANAISNIAGSQKRTGNKEHVLWNRRECGDPPKVSFHLALTRVPRGQLQGFSPSKLSRPHNGRTPEGS